MPDLLLELFSEEIPARMQRKAAEDLKKAVTDALVDNGLTYEGARAYWTPRRLTLDIRGVTARSADTTEERKGPRVDAPEKAIEGFLRGAGLSSADQAEIRTDPKKGDFYVAMIRKQGRAAEDIVAHVMPDIIRGFAWPKSMRWGAQSTQSGALRWVRPLQSIVCTFGPETEEPVIVDFEVGGIRTGNVTYGHRFHAPDPIKVRRFDDYALQLEKAKVVLDAERRKEMIVTDARNLAFANGIELVEDDGLLEEVAGLVEWPVVLMGTFEDDYLQIPDDVVRLTIKTNQKCFVCRGSDGDLTNKFILVANIEAHDGGADIARGNGKVVRARLSDALHFWRTDQADLPDLDQLHDSAALMELNPGKPLDQRMAKLDALGVTFHAKLGTQGERVRRIAALAVKLAPLVGADPLQTKRAAHLAKADLTTEIVGEFPDVQGKMGRIYALMQGESDSVARALEDHYKPQGPSDAVPSDPVSIAVALADKLDTLAGFWAIDEKPTGSKDPYALRRAALGVIRIVLENSLRLELIDLIGASFARIEADSSDRSYSERWTALPPGAFDLGLLAERVRRSLEPLADVMGVSLSELGGARAMAQDLLTFIHDRLKVYLRDKGIRHDLIDAVLHADDDDLLLIVRKAEALQKLLASETGANLFSGTNRALSLLAAEEKKTDEGEFDTAVNAAKLVEPAEEQLHHMLVSVSADLDAFLDKQDYEGAFGALAQLRPAIDAFFDSVMVNAVDESLRKNRLALLAKLRTVTMMLADFSKISG